MFTIRYADGWDKHFARFDKAVKLRILKKLEQLKRKDDSRHLSHGLPYFVEEVGGYRLVFKLDAKARVKTVCFIGGHKQYRAWYLSV